MFVMINIILCLSLFFCFSCDSCTLELPGVVRVIPNRLHKLQTTRSWDFLGLSSHSPNNILHSSNMGDGAIIGVFDTGS